jgi:hypothetical protein
MLRRLSNMPTQLMLAIILTVFAGGLAVSILQIARTGHQIQDLRAQYRSEEAMSLYAAASDFFNLREALLRAVLKG